MVVCGVVMVMAWCGGGDGAIGGSIGVMGWVWCDGICAVLLYASVVSAASRLLSYNLTN